MTKDLILLVDDDSAIRKMLRIALEAKGYATIEAISKKDAIESIALHSPKLVLLDLQLPDGSGLDVIKEVRSFSEIPFLVLSVMNSEEDKIALLDAGADDYITKPFSMGELLARIRTALRRLPAEETPANWESGNLVVDFVNYQVIKNGALIRLTPTEFQILTFLIKNSGKVITHDVLIKKIWGDQALNEMNSLRVHITQLRKKIEDSPSNPLWLLTEPGIGYRWAHH
ncbi:response regulator transcription factor [Leptospira sp. 2 VSF19]|uniref:Response regulator transcription factor n=1 Tax=Leptospira soteropolitanensis TaxID=2950025 RepID=A0AAW5VL05_9LEPT|nr:response regulator transcription factor [Leptospira soteropolitanensis]MCW7492984.1 response regulator transcription factor [Leptospira soteropolitanensis]MCW7500219.1 response regulator transcription factor [Leptospira soteropolitanensis]MCW7522470.1 response regulator transcription factor [Leptospira soteropolitanensis]MCW7526326.1 response regulator transcription factor [Leptospira soteropolitanensis]MCW7529562.1 response regulator transcription factor [Leptospira soteropolitanensis]